MSGVDSSAAFPTPFERKLRDQGQALSEAFDAATAPRHEVEAAIDAAAEPRHKPAPPDLYGGQAFGLRKPPPETRYLHEWNCYRCQNTWGTQDEESPIVPGPCPICGGAVELKATIDRRPG